MALSQIIILSFCIDDSTILVLDKNEWSDQRVTGRVFLTRPESDHSRDVITTTPRPLFLIRIHIGRHCLIRLFNQVLHPPATPAYLQHPTACLSDPARRLRKPLFPRYNIIGCGSFIQGHDAACPCSHT